ncbi:MAG: hypothetical protein OGMRLDGQ_002715 [Candidatus Fervidibacter sp.]
MSAKTNRITLTPVQKFRHRRLKSALSFSRHQLRTKVRSMVCLVLRHLLTEVHFACKRA